MLILLKSLISGHSHTPFSEDHDACFINLCLNDISMWINGCCYYLWISHVFHVSQLWKCVRLPMEVLPKPELEIEPDLSYQEHPAKVLD
jgi:hypothetical protein